MQISDIHKAGGIIIQNKKVLSLRSKGDNIFINPGGKLESDETAVRALVRELKEELSIDISHGGVTFFDTYCSQAATQPDKSIQLDAYLVNNFKGKLVIASEIEEMRWLTSGDDLSNVASILAHKIIPALQARGLID